VPQPIDSNGVPLPSFEASGTRANLTAGSTTSNTTIPTGSAGKWCIVRSTAPFWLNFGSSGAVTASAASTSILWTGVEVLVKVPTGSTHFAGLRAGSADVGVQLELVST